MIRSIVFTVLIQSIITNTSTEKLYEKRWLLHSNDDIASELMILKAELETTTKQLKTVLSEVNYLKIAQQNASESASSVKAELATTTKRFENEVATLTQEVNFLRISLQNERLHSCLPVETLSPMGGEANSDLRRRGTYTVVAETGGSVYTRWGRNTCPNDAELVYHGYIAGKKYNEQGSVSSNLCLPYTPTWGNYTDGVNQPSASIYGTEIDIVEPSHIFPYLVNNNNLPCAMCKSTRRTSVMIPARTNCYKDWSIEYTGYLVSSKNEHESYDAICLDARPEFVPAGGTDDNEHVLYLIEARCGSLPCPPYVDGRELACVVCTI